MTEIEAHETLEDLQRILTQYRHISKELTEANGIAINALEKQIPKKPKEKDCIGFNILACPECKMSLYSYELYCDNCGQAIDWSDEE